ncbi:hypothetical protein FQZ97_749700 [compost metagenome]
MAEKCDCLNICGDDRRVTAYEVEPCEWRVQCARHRLAELREKVRLRELDSRVGLLLADVEEYRRYRELVRGCLEGQALTIIDENIRLRADNDALRRQLAALTEEGAHD